MSSLGAPAPPEPRLKRLMRFLDLDGENLQLLSDCAQAAFDEGQPDKVLGFLDRHAALAPLSDQLTNLKGLAAIAVERFGPAEEVFRTLLLRAPTDPSLRFNLAWCRAMLKDYAGADEALDDVATTASPAAALLKLRTLHHLGRLQEALDWAPALVERFPEDTGLMGALAAVAIDAEDVALAAGYARRAGDSPDGLTTAGMLHFQADETEDALSCFDAVLSRAPQDARANLGRGLALMLADDPSGAARHIDRAAERFGDHLGSWVAAGWAYFVAGDLVESRRRFETALALDDSFAEVHGGLAALDAVTGDLASARRRCEVALRLDRASFGAALARMLMLADQGDLAAAGRVRDLAMNTPIAPGARTVAQAVAALGTRRGRGA